MRKTHAEVMAEPHFVPAERRLLIPWLLVPVEQANELDYITAESRRRIYIASNIRPCDCVHQTCKACWDAMRWFAGGPDPQCDATTDGER